MDPYMQRLYKMHAPRMSLRENEMNATTLTAINPIEISTALNNLNPFDMPAPKQAVSFDVKEGGELGTLADIFNAKKKSLKSKLESEKAKVKVGTRSAKKGRTKEEILELRRAMMRPKNRKKENCGESEIKEEENYCEPDSLELTSKDPAEGTQKTKQNKSVTMKRRQALTRLVEGAKPVISKAEMHKLTKKNYMQLPEVVEKAKEEQKKKERRDRLINAREIEKV